MKKLVVTMAMLMANVLALGAVESKLSQDENGRYSGSASLQLVATGIIVERPKTSVLVIKSENGDSAVNLSHKNIKNGDVGVTKEKFVATVYERDTDGNLVISKEKVDISSKLVSEVSQNEVAVQNIKGQEVGKVSYKLAENKKNKNSYVGEVTSKLMASNNNNGNFIDRSTNIEVMVHGK